VEGDRDEIVGLIGSGCPELLGLGDRGALMPTNKKKEEMQKSTRIAYGLREETRQEKEVQNLLSGKRGQCTQREKGMVGRETVRSPGDRRRRDPLPGGERPASHSERLDQGSKKRKLRTNGKKNGCGVSMRKIAKKERKNRRRGDRL